MNDQFSPGISPYLNTQQLAQLVAAARAAQQNGQEPPGLGSVVETRVADTPAMPSTTPFATAEAPVQNLPASGPGTTGPTKASAIQNLRQVYEKPHGRGAATTSSFPQLETPSADDIAKGNYIKVGFRHLLRNDPAELAFHTYVQIPQTKNGNATGGFDSYGVLGNPNSAKGENQQVRENDLDRRWGNADRNSQIRGYEGKEVRVKVTPEQRESLRQGIRYFTERDEKGNFKNPCPVCGDRYHLLGSNSNTFIYNMLFHNPAGPIPAPKPPSRWRTPGYYVNEPNEHWYQSNKSRY